MIDDHDNRALAFVSQRGDVATRRGRIVESLVTPGRREVWPSARWAWASAIVLSWLVGSPISSLQAQPPALVVATELKPPAVHEDLKFVGTLNPKRRSIVGSAVDGRVEEMHFENGQLVEARAPLARLLARTLEIQLAGAQAELQLRRHELEELTNGSRPEEIAQAKAAVAAAVAADEYTRKRANRLAELYNGRASTSLEELESAQNEATAAAQELARAQAVLDLAIAGPRAEKVAQARAKVEIQQQLILGLEDQLAKHTIRAPFAGVAVSKLTEVGEWVKQGQAIGEIIQLDPIEAEVQVPEQWVASFEVGKQVRLHIASRPGEFTPGTINRIVPQADLKARTFPVIVQLANPNRQLSAGMFVELLLGLSDAGDAVLVPKDALVLGAAGHRLFVVQDGPAPPAAAPAAGSGAPAKGAAPATASPAPAGPRVKMVPVELLTPWGQWYAVRGAVRWGDRVVVEGNERLQDGQPITILNRKES